MEAPVSGDRSPIPLTSITYAVGLPLFAAACGFSVHQILANHSTTVSGVGLGGIALFTTILVRLTVWSPPVSERRRLELFGALVVIAAGLGPLGGAAVMYIMTVEAFGATFLPPRVAVGLISVAAVGVSVIDAAIGTRAQSVFTDTVATLVIGLFALGVSRLAEANRALAAAREELAELAVSEERLRFARDLHDLLGHTLTVIRAKSELAGRLAGSDVAAAVREMGEVEAVARQALAEVREAVTGYRQSSLVSEIATARMALMAAGITAELPSQSLSFPSSVDAALGWVLREAVANVVRHSRATHCRVEAATEDRTVRLEVTDDGEGPVGDGHAGNGLTGMRERLASVGGTLEFGPGNEGGFRTVARVPTTA